MRYKPAYSQAGFFIFDLLLKAYFCAKKNNMKLILLSLATSILLFSCNVVNSTQFKKDNSGSISTYVDMSEFIDKMGGKLPDNTKEKVNFAEKKNANLDSITLIEYLNQVEGLTNIKSISDEKAFKFGVKLDFDSPKSLNQAVNRMGHFMKVEKDSSAVLKNFTYYKISKNSLELREPLKKKKEEESEEEFAKAAKQMAKMLKMEWQIELTGRKIKKIESDLEYKQDGKNKVTISMDGDQLTTREKEAVAVIKFK